MKQETLKKETSDAISNAARSTRSDFQDLGVLQTQKKLDREDDMSGVNSEF